MESKAVTDAEFHAALLMLSQYLLIINDMASCSEETEEDIRNRKNAGILKAYIFKHEILKVLKCAIEHFKPQRHSPEFLEDTIRLNHQVLHMLEEFSKGKILKVKT